jgi:hypothetical protein
MILVVLLLATVPLSLFTPITHVRGQSGSLVTLASSQRGPTGIAVSNGYVYWTDRDSFSVKKVPVEGGNVTVIARGPNGADLYGIAVDGGFVYYTDFHFGTVNRVSINGGTVQVLAQNQDDPRSILVRDGYVYWAEYLLGNIKRIHSDGSGSVEVVLRRRVGVSDMAINGSNIYWAEGAIQGADVSRIGRASIPNGTATATLFVKTIKPWSLTIRGGFLFWTEYRWGGVYKVPLNPGTIEIVNEPGLPLDDFMITSDDQNVYWTEVTSGNIMAAPVTGGPVTVLASNRTGPFDIASDGKHLVWTEREAGNVMLYDLTQPIGGYSTSVGTETSKSVGTSVGTQTANTQASVQLPFVVTAVAVALTAIALGLIVVKRYRQRNATSSPKRKRAVRNSPKN